jgi:hypothetical protein
MIFCDVMPCSLAENRRFAGKVAYIFRVEKEANQETGNKQAASERTVCGKAGLIEAKNELPHSERKRDHCL